MNLSLPPESEPHRRERDETNRQRLEALRKEINVGLQQIERDDYTTHDEASLAEMAEQIKAEGRRKLADRSKRDTNTQPT